MVKLTFFMNSLNNREAHLLGQMAEFKKQAGWLSIFDLMFRVFVYWQSVNKMIT